MKKMVSYTMEENVRDSYTIFDMMMAIKTCPVPVVARVNGAALGGGAGLVSACDMAFARIHPFDFAFCYIFRLLLFLY